MSSWRAAAARVCAAAVLILCPLAAAAGDVYVPPGGDLQAAINAARPGDTIRLAPGATYTGNFRLPAHGGTSYITIRSAAEDSLLPPQGARISPEFSAHLPRIQSPNSMPAISTRPGAAYWRLMFVEFAANYVGYYDIIQLGDGSERQDSLDDLAHHLVIDRVYMHGDPQHGQKRAIALNSGETTITGSYIAGIKAVDMDSQAIGGWNGPGPYRIENNYLEASGEVIMFGGSDPAIPGLVPSDIVIRGNTLTRPLSWQDPIVRTPTVRASAGSGGNLPAGVHRYTVIARQASNVTHAYSSPSEAVSASVGGGGSVSLSWDAVPNAAEYQVQVTRPNGGFAAWTTTGTSLTDTGAAGTSRWSARLATRWQVKSLLELKNARRVQVDYNVMANNWEEAQVGIAILFTPRNQEGGCTWCVVSDIAFEYNIVRGAGGGVNILGRDYIHPSQQTKNITIRHNEFSDISPAWGAGGFFLHLSGGPRDIVVDHNTIVSPDGYGVLNVEGPAIPGFVFTNNVMRHNVYGIVGTNTAPGLGTISHYFPGSSITNNVLAAPPHWYEYPTGNRFPSMEEFAAYFSNYQAGEFSLRPGTALEGAGTDGKALGANLPAAPR